MVVNVDFFDLKKQTPALLEVYINFYLTVGVKYALCSVFIVCYPQEKLLGKALSLSLCSLTVFSCSSCTVEVGEVVALPFLTFPPFFFFCSPAQTLQDPGL